MEEKQGKGLNFSRIYLGVILIFIGLTYLAKTIGLINVSFNFNLWQLWPILIIFIGLSLLSRGWLSLIVGSFTTLAVLGLINFTLLGSLNSSPKTETISFNKEAEAQSAVLDLEIGAGELTINSEKQTNALVKGNFESSGTKFTAKSEFQDKIQSLKISTKGSSNWPFFNRNYNKLDLRINPETPFKFNIDSGAAELDLDFREIMAESINVETGASKLELKLGDKLKESHLNLNAGASSVNITLPKSVGVKLNLESGLSSHNLEGFKRLGPSTYESDNYEGFEKKITLNLILGVSSLGITWE
jgi:hypothetical protein